jgi:hypothetical protein
MKQLVFDDSKKIRGCLFKTKFYPVDLDAHVIYNLPYSRERDLHWAWKKHRSVLGMTGKRLTHELYDLYRIVSIKNPTEAGPPWEKP